MKHPINPIKPYKSHKIPQESREKSDRSPMFCRPKTTWSSRATNSCNCTRSSQVFALIRTNVSRRPRGKNSRKDSGSLTRFGIEMYDVIIATNCYQTNMKHIQTYQKETKTYQDYQIKTSWWFQPIWKKWSSNWESSPNGGEKKHIWNHRPRYSPTWKIYNP